MSEPRTKKQKKKAILYTELSRIPWGALVNDTEDVSNDFPGRKLVNMGSLQRIADASEKMAANFTRLLADNQSLRDQNQKFERKIKRLEARLK